MHQPLQGWEQAASFPPALRPPPTGVSPGLTSPFSLTPILCWALRGWQAGGSRCEEGGGWGGEESCVSGSLPQRQEL